MGRIESGLASTASRYARVIDPEAGDSLALLEKWIEPRTTVLDVGTAAGALGEYLGSRKGCTVDGVERDLGAAALAGRHYRRLVIADLDRSDLASLFPPQSYDYVVCGDVLEHLARPEELLRSAGVLLRPGGHLLLSIPNVAYAPLLAELLGGQWRYRQVGLLDRTHLRFATRATLERLLADACFVPRAVARVVKPAHESEFDSRYLEALPPSVRLYLEELPEAFTYQWLVDAVACGPQEEPAEAAPEVFARQAERWSLPLRFVSRLYWRAEGSPYAADRQVQALGEIGAGPQTLSFALPAEAGGLAGLLWEPADRETILELRALRVVGPAGPVWSWSGSTDALRECSHERVTYVEREPPAVGCTLVIGAREPHVELPVGAEELAACTGACRVEADVSWPPSPESIRVLDRLQGGFRELEESLQVRDRLGVLLEERLHLLHQTEEAYREAVQDRDRVLRLLEERARPRWSFRRRI